VTWPQLHVDKRPPPGKFCVARRPFKGMEGVLAEQVLKSSVSQVPSWLQEWATKSEPSEAVCTILCLTLTD